MRNYNFFQHQQRCRFLTQTAACLGSFQAEVRVCVEAFFFLGKAFDAAAVSPVIGFLCGRCAETGSTSATASLPAFSATVSMFDALSGASSL